MSWSCIFTLLALLLGVASSDHKQQEQPQPTVFVHPPPPDPDPGRDWDQPLQPGPAKCKVVLQNSQFIPAQVMGNEEIFGGAVTSACSATLWYGCRNTTRYTTRDEVRRCQNYMAGPWWVNVMQRTVAQRSWRSSMQQRIQRTIELGDRDSFGVPAYERAQFLAAPKPTITGKWELSSINAHIAFDNMVVIRGSTTTTVAKSAVVTIAPTPAVDPQHVKKHMRTLPDHRYRESDSIYDQSLRTDVQEMMDDTHCRPVYAHLKRPHSQEDFISWLSKFGWLGSPTDDSGSNIESNGTENPGFDLNALNTMDIPFFLDTIVGQNAIENLPFSLDPIVEPNAIEDPDSTPLPPLEDDDTVENIPPSIDRCVEKDPYWAHKHNISSYPEPIHVPLCFFSGHEQELVDDSGGAIPGPDNMFAAVVTYSWWTDDLSTPKSRALKAIAQSNKDLAELGDCELVNDFPELAMQPPRMLRPVAGDMLAVPEITQRPKPPSPDETSTQGGIQGGSVAPSLQEGSDGMRAGEFMQGPTPSRIIGELGGIGNGGRESIPLSTISIGSERLQPIYMGGSQPVVVIGTNTIALNGPAVTINGEAVSLTPDAVVVGSKAIPIPQKPSSLDPSPGLPILLGDEKARIIKGPENQKLIVVGTSTATAFGTEYTVGGYKIQFAGDSVVVDGKVTYEVPAPAPSPTVSGVIKGSQSEEAAGSLAGSATKSTAKPNPDPRKKSMGSWSGGVDSLLNYTVGLLVLFLVLM